MDKETLKVVAGVYVVGMVLAALYIQPWDPRWTSKAQAWEYVGFWPYAIYVMGTK
jgi:hypothetical protein